MTSDNEGGEDGDDEPDWPGEGPDTTEKGFDALGKEPESESESESNSDSNSEE